MYYHSHFIRNEQHMDSIRGITEILAILLKDTERKEIKQTKVCRYTFLLQLNIGVCLACTSVSGLICDTLCTSVNPVLFPECTAVGKYRSLVAQLRFCLNLMLLNARTRESFFCSQNLWKPLV